MSTDAFGSSATITRTSDTSAYLAGDVIGPATGSTAAFALVGSGVSTSGEIIITTVQFQINVASIPSGMTTFRLYLYTALPPSALGDNAPWDLPSGDRNAFLGYVDLGTPVDLGSTLYVESLQVNKQLSMGGNVSGSLFAYLVTNGGYTPGSADVFKVTLHAVAL